MSLEVEISKLTQAVTLLATTLQSQKENAPEAQGSALLSTKPAEVAAPKVEAIPASEAPAQTAETSEAESTEGLNRADEKEDAPVPEEIPESEEPPSPGGPVVECIPDPTEADLAKARVERQKICNQYFGLLQAKGCMSEPDARGACKRMIAEICGEGNTVSTLPFERHFEFMALMAAKLEELEHA